MFNSISSRLGVRFLSHQFRRVLLFCGALLIVLAAACSAPTSTPTPTRTAGALVGRPRPTSAALGPPAPVLCPESRPPGFIKQLVLAKRTSEAMAPVEETQVFAPTQDKFHAVVSIENAPASTQLQAIWYLIEAQGKVTNAKLDETEQEVTGTGNIDFTLTPVEGLWLPGTYCVEIYANGQAALSKQFRVQASSAAGHSPVVNLTLTQDVVPNTFEPLNPTRTLPSTAPVIHCVVQIQEAAPNTEFQVKWQLPQGPAQEFALTTQGSRRLDFTLKPPGSAFDAGAYRVQLYVNGVLDRTEEFTVE